MNVPESVARSREITYRVSLIILATIATLVALKYAQELVAPMALAFVTAVVFAPVTDGLARIGLPRWLSALSFLTVLLLLCGLVALVIEPGLRRLIEELPTIRWQLRMALQDLQGALRSFQDVNEGVKEVIKEATGNGDAQDAPSPAADMPNLTDAVLLAPYLIAQMLIFAGTLYFLLISRLELYAGVSRLVGGRDGAADFKLRLRRAEEMVSRYFLTVTFVNAGLGVAVAAAMSLIGLSMPIAWGIAAMILNYILYLGPGIFAVALLLAGVVSFSGAMVLLPMASFLFLNVLEAQFVTPLLVGRSMAINPLLIFASVVFWIWFWGPIGGIVAIPLLLMVLVVSESPLLGDGTETPKVNAAA